MPEVAPLVAPNAITTGDSATNDSAANSPDPTPGPVTYGEAQEAAAHALNQLVVFDDLPTSEVDIELMLQCRHAVISAIGQRLFALGLERIPQVKAHDVSAETLSLADFAARPTAMLGAVAGGFATLSEESRARPSDLLGPRQAHPTVERWRSAAVALLAGSHALDASLDQPWLRDDGAGWYVVRDLAVTIEAVVVLDTRLREVGLLNQLQPGQDTLVGEGARLVASQVARTAAWHATNDAADRAIPECRDRGGGVVGPVRLVSRPTDIAPAQRQLARFLQGLGAKGARSEGYAAFSSSIVRMVLASQLMVVTYGGVLAGRCRDADVSPVRRWFAERTEVLQHVQAAAAHLVDREPVDDDKRVPWQQGEITTAIRRLERTRTPAVLTAEQLLDLAGATHEATRVIARNLRRELLRDTGNLRSRDLSGQIGHTRVHKGHPLDRALIDLYNLPPPTTPVARYQRPQHRSALRSTLELTPTQNRPPAPFTHPRPPQRGGPSW